MSSPYETVARALAYDLLSTLPATFLERERKREEVVRAAKIVASHHFRTSTSGGLSDFNWMMQAIEALEGAQKGDAP